MAAVMATVMASGHYAMKPEVSLSAASSSSSSSSSDRFNASFSNPRLSLLLALSSQASIQAQRGMFYRLPLIRYFIFRFFSFIYMNGWMVSAIL